MDFAKIRTGMKTLMNFRKVKFERETRILNSITEQMWENASKEAFRQKGDSRSSCLELFEDIETALSDSKLPKNFKESLNILKRKANLTAGFMENALARGEEAKGSVEKFCKLNKKEIDVLKKYFEKCRENGDFSKQDLSNRLNRMDSSFSGVKLYDNRIDAMPEHLLDLSKPFYHGSKSPLKIAKNGFDTTPRLIQSFFTREMGDAVYLTPDKEVAAFFAGLKGGLVKADVSSIKNSEVAFVNEKKVNDMIWAMAKNRIPINDATVKELYGRNGYKAAFSKKCINSASKIDDIMGHDESQLAVFNPKDIDIKSPLDVTVRELLENQKLKVQGKINGVKFSLNSFKKVCELVKDNFNRKYKQA